MLLKAVLLFISACCAAAIWKNQSSFSVRAQVQYLYRVFCRLRPGISILALHGRQQQMRRMEVYNEFVRKRSAVLFATDIAARGLGKSLAENILGSWDIEFAYKWMDLGIQVVSLK